MDDRRWDELARLRDEAGDTVRLLAAAHQPDARFTAGDATGAVTVAVDGDGRIRAVTVNGGWRGRVGATGLADAVRDAVRAAGTARLRAWSAAVEAGAGPPGADAGAGPPGADLATDADTARVFARRLAEATDGVPVDAARGCEVLREILSMLTAIDESLDELSTHLRLGAERVSTGRSGAGHVEVRIDGSGALVAVDVDQRWLRDAAETRIARELGEAFESAYGAAAAHSPRSLIARSPLGVLQPLAADPALLAQRLGLHAGGPSPAGLGRP
ncbi:hypothetical protein HC031_02275 [Planosporangium thailandense]|uniref:YbaB/EbfC DNA-binding family protein n=1 Tax=Planosporangium thailandense TaxID=765197 RepID=A0ABX0XTE2_9ACTN|nr:hypothetical protein [Planosporangium thailandense]NJC68555.1 hypothetical protein [Planosporangium thailandense]